MFYKVEYQKRAHQEVEKIFRVLLPEQGLAVREEQIRLCHEMLDTLLEGKIALCDAGVGIGKTYAYLVACVLMRKYSVLAGRYVPLDQRPVVITTSSVALQKAILSEYIPFLSRVLVEQGIIQSPLRAVIRKGKEHFVCDNRLEQRLEAVRHKQKNAIQKEALLSLRRHYDMDEVQGISGFDRRLVCVPKFCPRECPRRTACRYQRYLEEAKNKEIFIQICNHNTVRRTAFSILYYLEFLIEKEMELTDVYGYTYDRQTEHFVDFLYWLKKGNHWEQKQNKYPNNGTCNAYLKDVFRFYLFIEAEYEQYGELKTLSYNRIVAVNEVGVKRVLRRHSFKGYLKEDLNVALEQQNELLQRQVQVLKRENADLKKTVEKLQKALKKQDLSFIKKF